MEVQQKMESLLKPLVRSTILLDYVAKDPSSNPGPGAGSHFGGRPFLGAGESWPACPQCRAAMEFVFQVDFREIPGSVSKEFRDHDCDLFTFFVCRACHYWPPFFEFRKYKAPTAHVDASGSPWELLPRFRIEVESGLSLPDWEGADLWAKEVAELSVRSNAGGRSALFKSCRERLVAEDDSWGQIGGYPYWIQDEETPECEHCKQPMRMLFQIGNVLEANLMWIDRLGSLYLFYCPQHFETRELVLQST